MSAITSVTIWRTAVTQPLRMDEPRDDGAEFAHIVAEIAERLEELDEIKRESAADLLLQLAALGTESRKALRITIQLLHGNYAELLASYQDQANRRGVTKQDVHWEYSTELAAIKRHFPTLHKCIERTRAQAMQHEDPMSKLQVATPGAGMSE